MMRGSTALVLPFVCLVLGLGAGYVFFAGEASPGGDDTELTGDSLPSQDGGSTPEPMRAATLEGRGKADQLAAVLQAIPVPEREIGEGIIRGRVTDPSGSPVAGARMTLSARSDASAYTKPDPDDDPDVALLKQMREMMKRHRKGSAYRQVATTAEDGTYRFEGVTDRLHQIQALREGYLIYPRDRSAWQGTSPGATVDFLATPQARLRIELIGSARPKSLSVELRQGRGSMMGMQWSPGNPVLDVQPGSYDVHVKGGSQMELRGGPYPVVLEAGAEVYTLRVELEARPVLRLHLKYAQDEVMPLFTYIMPSPAGGLPTSAVLKARGKFDMQQWVHHSMLSPSAEEQLLTFNDVTEGPHVIGIARDRSGSIVHMEEVVVRAGVVDHVMEVPPLDPKSYVIVAAYGPDGELVRDARYSTGYRSESGGSSGGSRTALRRDGRVLVMHNERGVAEDGGGTWWVDVSTTNLGSKRVEYARGQTRELRVDFQEPAEVGVVVKGVKGTPYEGRVSVSLSPMQDGRGIGGGRGGGTTPDKQGAFLVRGLQPGEYRISLSVSTGERQRSVRVADLPYVVKSGSQQTTVALPPLFTLTVRGATRRVSLSSRGKSSFRSHQTQTADADGVAVFDALPAGTYQVRSGSGRAEVTLPGPSSITLEKRSRR